MSAPGETDVPVVPGGQEEATSIVSGGGKHGKGKRAGKGKGKGGKGKGKHGGKGGKGGKRSKPVDRSTLAGLTFPVGRIHRRLRDRLLRKQRCGPSAAVYLAAMLEYLTAEIIELAIFVCKERGTTRIKPRELLLAIRGDDEISNLVTATISRGGVMPQNMHKKIARKKSTR